MKKFIAGLIALPLLGYSLGALAQNEVIIEERPATLMRQGDVYVIPEGTTTSYYTYTDAGTAYTCTVTEPTELVNVKGNRIKVKMDGEMKEVTCYPSKYFVVK